MRLMGALLPGFLIAGCAIDITKPPPRHAENVSIPVDRSALVLTPVVPVIEVQKRLNNDLPYELDLVKRDEDIINERCICGIETFGLPCPPSARACWKEKDGVLTAWGHVERTDVTLSLEPDRAARIWLVARTRVDAALVGFFESVHAGTTVPIGGTGRAEITLSAALAIQNNGCPRLDFQRSILWRPEPHIVFGGWVINRRDDAETEVHRILNDAEADLRKTIDCNDLLATIRPVWRIHSFEAGSLGGRPQYLNLFPHRIGVRGFAESKDHLGVTVIAEADAWVSGERAPDPTLPLVGLSPIAHSDEFEVTVPFLFSYDALSEGLASALNGKAFDGSGHYGDARIRIDRVEIYPSGQRAVFAVCFTAERPWWLFNLTGCAYLFGVPVVEAAGSSVTLRDVDYTVRTDSDFWNAFFEVFRSQLQAELKKSATLDLAPQLAALERNMTDGALGSGFELSRASGRLKGVLIGQQLTVSGELKGELRLPLSLAK